MREDGYDAGAIGHLFVFSEQVSDDGQKRLIAVLGSSAPREDGRHIVPLAEHTSSNRRLQGHLCDLAWSQHYSFLGVRWLGQ